MYYCLMLQQKRRDSFAHKSPIRKLSVLVAVYNEERTLVRSITELSEVLNTLLCPYEIIVIESNSEDNSRNLLLSLNSEIDFKLIFQDKAEGKGSAIRLAMSKMSGDVFLIFDADLEYSPGDIPKLLEQIELGNSSFVLGTRHTNGKPIRSMDNHVILPFIMNQAHKFFTGLLNISLNVKMTDPFTMYKVFRSEVFKSIPLYSNRFDFDWELVIKSILRGSIPCEVPVRYKARSFSDGKKVRIFHDPILWLLAFFRFRYFEKIK